MVQAHLVPKGRNLTTSRFKSPIPQICTQQSLSVHVENTICLGCFFLLFHMLCWQIKCQFFIENLMHQYIFSLKIDIIIMCCLNFKTWIWSPFPLYSIFWTLSFWLWKQQYSPSEQFSFLWIWSPFLLYSIFGLKLYDCENNINLFQSNFLFKFDLSCGINKFDLENDY